MLSTGGTAKALREAGLDVKDVADVTGFPEMMDGRVKTLHPVVHGGLAGAARQRDHVAAMDAHDIGAIDLVVVNLYPFEETVAKGADYDTCIENIDIGGPAMIRSAAKNHGFVNVVVDVEDYDAVLAELDANDGQTTYALRQRLAQTAYARTAAYDTAVSTGWRRSGRHTAPPHLGGTLAQTLRYGENPHQRRRSTPTARTAPAWPRPSSIRARNCPTTTSTTPTRPLNWSASLTRERPRRAPSSNTPTRAAWRTGPRDRGLHRAFDCDRTSAFGGIIALNQPLDGDTAEEISGSLPKL